MALLNVYGDPQEKQKVKGHRPHGDAGGSCGPGRRAQRQETSLPSRGVPAGRSGSPTQAHPLDLNDTLHSGPASSTRGSKNLPDRENRGSAQEILFSCTKHSLLFLFLYLLHEAPRVLLYETSPLLARDSQTTNQPTNVPYLCTKRLVLFYKASPAIVCEVSRAVFFVRGISCCSLCEAFPAFLVRSIS